MKGKKANMGVKSIIVLVIGMAVFFFVIFGYTKPLISTLNPFLEVDDGPDHDINNVYLDIIGTEPEVYVGFGWKCSKRLLKADENGEYWLKIYFEYPVADTEGKYEIYVDDTLGGTCPGYYAQWTRYYKLMNEDSNGCQRCLGCTKEELNSYLKDEINEYLLAELPQNIEPFLEVFDKTSDDYANTLCALTYDEDLYKNKNFLEFIEKLDSFTIDNLKTKDISDFENIRGANCEDILNTETYPHRINTIKGSIFESVVHVLFDKYDDENCKQNIYFESIKDDVSYTSYLSAWPGEYATKDTTACVPIKIYENSKEKTIGNLCLGLQKPLNFDWPRLTIKFTDNRKTMEIGPFPRGELNNGMYYLIKFISDKNDKYNSWHSIVGENIYIINPDRNVVKFEVP